ncbi:MAG: transglutaminase family protein [Terrimicrobiaceae bacterium]
MRISVHYSAHYQYARKTSFSPHRVRLFPRNDLFLHIERIVFSTDASAGVQYRHDLFDNLIATCLYPESLDHLGFELEFDAVLQAWDPFHFVLESHALRLPFDYLPEEAAVLAPFRRPKYRTFALPEPLSPAPPRPTVEAIVAMNYWLHENIKYERREEGDPFAPQSTLKGQKGSCRDFAVLLVEVLRRHGLAARLASGYLWEDNADDGLEYAENAFHAWVETYLPGAGWIGLDPTNGILCDHHFLAAAVGLTPGDIAPIVGNYYGDHTIASDLDAVLSITKS